MSRMCIDPGLYEPDEYWRSISVNTAEQVRHERLWRAVEANDRPAHLAECTSCAELYESFVRLRAISVLAPGPEQQQIAVTHCPDAAAIAAYQGGEVSGHSLEAIREHLKGCAPCREDVAFLARSLEPRDRLLGLRTRMVLMAIAAAALLATVIPWKRGQEPAKEVKLTFKPNSQYAHLSQMPEVDRAEIMAESPESHHSRLEQVLEAYESGQFAKAEEYAGIMSSVVEDPSAEYLLAMSRYKQNKIIEGYKAMLVSERTTPHTAKRCWATMQYALLVGDREGVKREAGHAEGAKEFAPRCRDVLLRLG